jgi:hypothetical protein
MANRSLQFCSFPSSTHQNSTSSTSQSFPPKFLPSLTTPPHTLYGQRYRKCTINHNTVSTINCPPVSILSKITQNELQNLNTIQNIRISFLPTVEHEQPRNRRSILGRGVQTGYTAHPALDSTDTREPPGVQSGRAVKPTTHLHLVLSSTPC